MKALLNYWSPESQTNPRSVITKTKTLEGSEEEVFKLFYKMNNRLRYCNGSFYTFVDDALQERYRQWYKSLDESTKFDMFYGKGLVD